MSVDNKNDDMLWWIILFTILENEKGNWDRLRSKETELLNLVQQEYSEYFNKLFANGIPNYTLKSNTTLFRARHIKSGDIPKPGVNISDVMDSYYRIILTNEEINKIENINNSGESTYNFQLFSMLKAMGMDRLSEEQQKKSMNYLRKIVLKKFMVFQKMKAEYLRLYSGKPDDLIQLQMHIYMLHLIRIWQFMRCDRQLVRNIVLLSFVQTKKLK